MISEAINFSTALGAARDQGSRPTCLAFTSSDFNQIANSVEEPLSVEYLCHGLAGHSKDWKPGQGFSLGSAISALQSHGQPVEASYLYLSPNAANPLGPVPTGMTPIYTCAATRRNLSTNDVISRVNGGLAVALVVRLTPTFYRPVNGIVKFSSSYIPDALHALLAVGLGVHKDSNQTHVLIRNSWGNAWGSNGHAWLPSNYLDDHLLGSFAL
jgi:C1A family cysteine protease